VDLWLVPSSKRWLPTKTLSVDECNKGPHTCCKVTGI
jgi:hypothetical protein